MSGKLLLSLLSQWLGFTISMSLLAPIMKGVGGNEMAILFFGVPAVFAAWWGGGYLGFAIEGLLQPESEGRVQGVDGVATFMVFFGPAIGAVTAYWLWG
jgi:hypothetical protein